MPTLDSVADALYGLDPAEFVAARTEYAAAARESGDRELTVAIGRLRKPTVAAWMVNLLARHRPAELGALTDLGGALRSAQRTLSGHELRRLSAQRRRLVAALEQDAAALAAEHGRRVTDGALREVAQTLNAAVADPGVAERVRAGRLAAVVEHSGFDDLLAAPLSVVPGGPAGATPPESAADGGDRPEPDRDERDRAKAAAEAAHAAVEAAKAAAREADTEAERQESEVARLRHELDHAEQQRRFARRARSAARKEVAVAERAAAAADAALRRLTP